jgi:hypothetical protein
MLTLRRNILPPSSGLKMETVCFSEKLESNNESTRRQNPEEHHHPHRRENLKNQSLIQNIKNSHRDSLCSTLTEHAQSIWGTLENSLQIQSITCIKSEHFSIISLLCLKFTKFLHSCFITSTEFPFKSDTLRSHIIW